MQLAQGPTSSSRAQILFLYRDEDLERRAQAGYTGHTLSTLNTTLAGRHYRTTCNEQDEGAPLNIDWNAEPRLPQSIVRSFNYMGVMDVVKPVGTDNGFTLKRSHVGALTVNCVVGGRVPRCINYWVDRPVGAVNGTTAPGVREHLFLWLLLRPIVEFIPGPAVDATGDDAAGDDDEDHAAGDEDRRPPRRGQYRYYYQYVPVCTFYRKPPTVEEVWGRNRVSHVLDAMCPAIFVGYSSFIDDRNSVNKGDVDKFCLGNGRAGVLDAADPVVKAIDMSVLPRLPTLTVIVGHNTA